MARNNIDIGALGNPATGDTLRTAMIKINNNFEELYIGNAADGQLTTSVTNGDISIQPNGTGTVEIDALSVNSDNITSLTTNSSVTITGNGTAGVDIEGISVNGTTITSSDSSTININENLIVDGTGDFSGTLSVTGASTLTAGATIDGISITDNTITTSASNANLELTASGTGSVSIDGIQISGTEISSSDSTQITIKENLHVTGNITGTIDADNSTVSNLEVDNFKAASIVTEAEGIGSNDNDTTIPTSAAVKDYVDNNAGGTTGDLAITGSTISTPSNADLTLSPGGTGSVQTPGVTITDNKITSNRSNDNLELNASGTGTIVLENLKVGTGATVTTILDEDNMSSDSATALATQQSIKAYVDSQAGTGGMTFSGNTMSGSSNADIEITPGGTGAVVLGDAIRIRDNHLEGTRSNEDVIIDPAGTGQVVANAAFKFNAGYVENINTLTSSSTITVNCALASIHKVTLATSTEFNITNLPTGGTVTLIITQDGSGSRTATFGTDGSSAVKFPSNSSTLSTGAADIDVVTIINDGTNFLGNIAKDYRSS